MLNILDYKTVVMNKCLYLMLIISLSKNVITCTVLLKIPKILRQQCIQKHHTNYLHLTNLTYVKPQVLESKI